MPTGVSATAITNIFHSNASLSLSATLITHALAPLALPLLTFMALGQSIHIDLAAMALALGFCIFVPAFIYFAGVRKVAALQTHVRSASQFWCVLLTGVMVAVVMASQRAYFFNDMLAIIPALLAGCVFFALAYALGWGLAGRGARRESITYAICSGVNNSALAVALAALYFPAFTVFFMVIAELSWTLAVMAFKALCNRAGT